MNRTDKLVDGYITENQQCPFSEECCDRTCPRYRRIAPNKFSCGMARAFNIISKNQLNEFARKQKIGNL